MDADDFFATREPSHEHYEGWDADTSKPGMGLVQNALQFWSVQNYPTSVAAAAAAFRMTASDVMAAVEAHPWMYLEGPRDNPHKLMIEHEGE